MTTDETWSGKHLRDASTTVTSYSTRQKPYYMKAKKDGDVNVKTSMK